jgi:hypothetical protein
MTEANQNPLAKFYRQEAFRTKLPSRGAYYDETIVNLDDNQEIGIIPMTAQDEIMLKTPDSLLTGKALVDVIKSCVPEVVNPKKLLACDIDALMISIRRASYGEEADFAATCPECETENTYSIDLETIVNHSETLDSSYEVILPQGLTLFLKPGTFDTLIRQYKVAFENQKAQRALTTTASEEVAIQLFSKAFKDMAKLNFELMVEAIIKVVYTEDGEEKEITNKKHIAEFISNIDKRSVDIIDEKLAEINKVGIERTFDAVCKECGHKWGTDIEFNPVNFS